MKTKLYHRTYQEEAQNYKERLHILGYNYITCNLRYHVLKEFFYYLESNKISELKQIKAKTIDHYYSQIQNKKSLNTGENLKHKTIQDYMRYIKNYLEYAKGQGKIKTNPASHLEFKYIFESIERFVFTPSQIQELYKASNLLEKAILNIGYGCALRVGEIERINKIDVDLVQNRLIVQKGKNNKRRIVPINNTIKTNLEKYLSRSSCNQKPLFINSQNTRMREWTFNRILKGIVLKTPFGNQLTSHELNKISFHSLRHSIATHLLQNGMKLEQVQRFLGHTTIESTTIYTHVYSQQLKQLIHD
jgi:integrase/recombinase XerD